LPRTSGVDSSVLPTSLARGVAPASSRCRRRRHATTRGERGSSPACRKGIRPVERDGSAGDGRWSATDPPATGGGARRIRRRRMVERDVRPQPRQWARAVLGLRTGLHPAPPCMFDGRACSTMVRHPPTERTFATGATGPWPQWSPHTGVAHSLGYGLDSISCASSATGTFVGSATFVFVRERRDAHGSVRENGGVLVARSV
jgi:hypothetical protein